MRLTSLVFALAWVAVTSAREPAEPIPQNPLDAMAVPAFTGAPATPHAVRSFRVPQHSFMAPNGRSNLHDDAYMTDNYVGPGPLGRNMVVQSTYHNMECGSLTFDSGGRIVTICVGLVRPTLFLFDPANLDTLARFDLPPRSPRPGAPSPFSDFCGGGYFYLDNFDRVVTSTNNRQIWVLSETGTPAEPAFTLTRSYDVSAVVGADDCLVSVLPDWTGRLWFVSALGVVGTVDPVSGQTAVLPLANEAIANSFAVDRKGVFIVSDHALYRFEADRTGAPAVVWREPYDRGSRQKPGQVSQGSGTTPTLVGPRYVAITDNADPRMNVLVYRRGRRTSRRRLHCAEPVFTPGASATDNSLIAAGRALVVENNYGYSGPAATEQGRTTEPGITRVDIDGRGCHTTWTSMERAPSSVAKASLASGLVYAYTKDPGPGTIDAWYFTAIDFVTGATVYKRLAGTGLGYNNNYAPVSLGADGTAYVGALGGLVQLRDSN